MRFEKKMKQALLVVLCQALMLTAFIVFPINVKAAGSEGGIISSIEIDTDLFRIAEICGPAYTMREIYYEIRSFTGPGSIDYKGYYVNIYIAAAAKRNSNNSILYSNRSDSMSFMSEETLKNWEEESNGYYSYTAFYLLFAVGADTRNGYYFDPSKRPTLSFKGAGGTGNFKFMDTFEMAGTKHSCNSNTMWIGLEIPLNTSQKPRISQVILKGGSDSVGAGHSSQYSAEVYAYKLDESVIWSVSGNKSQGTVIDKNGLLHVGLDEPTGSITVIAASKADPSEKDEKTVEIMAAPEMHRVELTNKKTKQKVSGNETLTEYIAKDERVEYLVKSFGKIPGYGSVPGVDYDDAPVWYDEITVKPIGGVVSEHSRARISSDNTTVYVYVGPEETLHDLYYEIASGYDPSKYVILHVIVGSRFDIKYNANGGSFTKNLNETVVLENPYQLADCTEVTPPAGKIFKCWEYNGKEYGSGEIITLSADAAVVKAIFTSYFTEQPKSIYNKNDRAEKNGFAVSEAIKGWSIERNESGIFNTFDFEEMSYAANTYISFLCGVTGNVWPGEYRIKAELKNGDILYSNSFVVADAIESVEISELDMPIADELLDFDVAIRANPKRYSDMIEKTVVRWSKAGTVNRYLMKGGKAVDGQAYVCEVILTPAEGYGFEPGEDGSYAMDVYSFWRQSGTKVSKDGKLYITFEPFVAAPAAALHGITGNITSVGTAADKITIQLYRQGSSELQNEAILPGNAKIYSLKNVTAGTYTLKVTQNGCASTEKTVTVGSQDVQVDVELKAAVTKLATPVITKLENASTGVKATWDAVEGAEMYRLMYKEPGGNFVTGGYTTGTSYTVKNLTSGVEYYFTVRCMTADKKTNTSDYNRVGTPITYIAAPVLQKVENAANGVKVTWDLSAGAELYKVMYKEPDGSYKTAGYTAENNYTVTGLTAGVEYTFTARCMTADKKTYTSSYNSKGLTIVYQPAAAKLDTPKITKLENASTGVKATWDAVEGAEMYRLMYKEPGGSFVTGGYTTGTSYTVKNLTSGVEYYFTVRCMTADKKTNTSDYDRVGTPITYIAAPALKSVENAANGVKLTWNLSAGAELYKVMYKEAGGSYKTAGYTAENNYTVTGLTAGTEYTFTARCIMADKKTYTSSYDSKGLTLVYQPAAVKLATPVITKLENTNSGVKVTWGAVEGAEMYRLMYKEPDGSFKTGGYTTGTSYTVKDVTGGVTYTFTVRCMTADKKTNTSDYDKVGTSITYIASPVLTKVYNTASGVKVTWQASAGAELYKVMYMGPDGTWKTGGYTTSTGYTVKNLTEGTAYAFTVRCMTADKSAYTSGYDKTGLSITYVKP